MDKFVIEGGHKLSGKVKVSGSKNASLPIISACLMIEGKCVLRNVPHLSDVETISKIVTELGLSVKRREDDALELELQDEKNCTARYELVSQMRASICVLGPLLAKRKKAKVSYPGGCVIGNRPIDLHIKGLNELGVSITMKHGYIIASGKRMRGKTIFLGGNFGSTVTGTENLVMSAVLTKGTTIIENAAMEPEVVDLCNFLNKAGAKIQGIGSHTLIVEGVNKLNPVEYSVIPDRIEAGTFIAIAGVTESCITIENGIPSHLGAVLNKAKEVGFNFELFDKRIKVIPPQRICPADITTLPYPCFPTDLQAQFTVLLCKADGISIITERIYPDRFMHIAELNRMGANIRKEGVSAIIEGRKELFGAKVMASDLRASAALLIAGLTAKGTTELQRVYHIDRGYEKIDEKLKSLGAKIERKLDKKIIVQATENLPFVRERMSNN